VEAVQGCKSVSSRCLSAPIAPLSPPSQHPLLPHLRRNLSHEFVPRHPVRVHNVPEEHTPIELIVNLPLKPAVVAGPGAVDNKAGVNIIRGYGFALGV